MQVTETLSAGLKREYKVVVGQAELDKELNAKLADMSKRANIKGFRPGKVPVAHLRRVYDDKDWRDEGWQDCCRGRPIQVSGGRFSRLAGDERLYVRLRAV